MTLGDSLCDLRARARARGGVKSVLRGPFFHIDLLGICLCPVEVSLILPQSHAVCSMYIPP